MTDVVGDIRRRTTSGVRAVIVLNLASLPLSFATNILLGRVSAEALGYYGAVLVMIGTYYTFGVFGGSLVFTRFVPGLERRDRLSFLLSYVTLVVLFYGFLAWIVPLTAGDYLHAWLGRLGVPSAALAAWILLASVPMGFTSYFLYATMRPAWAVVTEKTVIAVFFLAAAAGVVGWRDRLSGDPAGYVWTAALWTYALASAVGLLLVARTAEARDAPRLRWLIPVGFWPAVSYTLFANLVSFVYATLTPTLVLLWLDVASLGHLHAAMRYVAVLDFVPAAVASVLVPSISQLAASGFREQGLVHMAAAVRTTLLLTTPAVLALILFSDDAMAVFGPQFREHGPILAVVAVGALAGPTVLCGAGAAAAIGAFRSYLAASLIYVTLAVTLTVGLVPWLGLRGAALAVPVGALVRQTAILFVLRRLGLPRIPRIAAAWLCSLVALGLSLWLAPSRLWAALLWLACVFAFAVSGRLTLAELRVSGRRLVGWE
jgi:O-antigen/teichoic acid export membrane protein